MTRFVTYSDIPNFPPEDQFGPGTVREKIGDLWIDHIDGKPTDEEIAARFAPPESVPDLQSQIDALKKAVIAKTAVTEKDIDAQVTQAAVAVELPS